MPYVFDGVVCEAGGRTHLYQLLVMPFVAPRAYSLRRYPDRNGFPWESAWEAADELFCADRRNRDFDNFFEDAVHITHNNGCWRVSPVPEPLRQRPEDALMTYIEYYVDTNPGGNLAALAGIVNKATSIAMPALHENLMFHGERWEEHLRAHHPPEDLARYREEVNAFRRAAGF